jgi:hypothetical protein
MESKGMKSKGMSSHGILEKQFWRRQLTLHIPW